MGGRKDIGSIETATINKMIIDLHQLTQNLLCINQDDTMGCYDRIIRHHAILCSRKVGISNNIYKLHYQTHDKMQFKTQINNKMSITSHQSTEQLTFYEVGQGCRNGGIYCIFISVPMMEVIEESVSLCTI